MAGAEWFIQLPLVAIAVVAVVAELVVGQRRSNRSAAWLVAALTVLAVVIWSAVSAVRRSEREASRTALTVAVPDRGLRDEGFVTSTTCRACHPHQHSTWHDSYHRTMTQVAGPETVLGDFANVTLSSRGRQYTLRRIGGEFYADMVDPDWEHDLLARGVYPNTAPNPPVVRKRVVMTTGSHHMQTYWVASERDGRLFNLPWTWLNKEQRWVPREDVFLRPPDAGRAFGTWHDNCVECHCVAGEQGYDPASGLFDPRVAELGISCEACHGPAAEHVRANRDPRRRYRLHLSGEPDPTIVNPARLPARRSAQVCGQCHGLNVFKGDVQKAGVRYRAGDDLTETRMVLRVSDEHLWDDEREDWPRLQRHIARQPETFLAERMWSDGMVRISGREHNQLVESECFMGGELSCLSCHSMHSSSPDDQLAAGMGGDEACFQCHGDYRDRIEAHTHHRADSSGSRCMNCHMPHTVYGLMGAIRTHQIHSPTAASSLETGRPNACSLCHLDRPLAWAAGHLSAWYGQDPVDLPPDLRTIAVGVHRLLTGDAAQRAIVAWHLGWGPAREASGEPGATGERWMAPYLGHLLDDPYSCVRHIAHRSLRSLPGFEWFDYDYIGPPEHRRQGPHRVARIWEQQRPRHLREARPELLLDERGGLDVLSLTRLARLRDDTPVDLRE